MVAWYEKIRNILKCVGSGRNEAVLTLIEDYFDIVMAVHDHNSSGKMQVLENFILKACSLVADKSISAFIKQEAVRKLNLMLDTIPRETRKRLIFTKEMMTTMSAMSKQILDAGDYDLQVAITEALCRMTSEAERRELASQWFPMDYITTAFKGIKDSEFETDCRKFLNMVNGMLGDKRSVFTYPCLSAHLDNHKFQAPSDEKLEQFWIDFNVGTQSISFYVSTDENHQWETVCINESEVEMYNIEEINSKRLLTVSLNTPTTISQIKGSQICIYFDSALDISSIVRKVFGANKCKGFFKKQSVSVAKSAVHIVFDESGSQLIIPESQASVTSSKEVTLIDTCDIAMKKQPPLFTPYHNQEICKESSSRIPPKLVTPSRSKVSEASINISVAGCMKIVNSLASSKTPILGRGRTKPPLEMIRSVKRSTAPIKNYTGQTQQAASPKKTNKGAVQPKQSIARLSKGDEPMEIVPDTQFTVQNSSLLLPSLKERNLGLTKKHPMCTRQKEKIPVNGGCISNKDKACGIVNQQQTCPVLEGKKDEQTPVAKVSSEEKTKARASDQRKRTTKEKNMKTEVKERNIDKQTSSFTEICRNSIQNSNTHLFSETESNKNRITEVANSRNYVTKRKDCEKNVIEKNKIKEATNTFVSKIGNTYSKEALKRKIEDASSRQNLKISSKKTNKENKQNKRTKGSKQLNIDREEKTWNDVYSFPSKDNDEPTIELGVSSIFISKQMVNIAVTNARPSSVKTKKSDQVREEKLRNAQKHLFSDTDTDRGGDDSKTDISWLQDLGSKRKPNIVGYSRQKQARQPKEKTVSSKAVDISTQNWKQKEKWDKKSCDVSLDTKDSDMSSKKSKVKRPQRATVKRKKKTEVSISEPESEEEPKPPSRKQTPKHQHALLTTKKNTKELVHSSTTNVITPKMREDSAKSSKVSASPVYKKPVSSINSSSGSVELMRSEQYESDPELQTSHPTIAHSSPSLSGSPSEQQTSKESMNMNIDLKKDYKQWTKLGDKSTSKQVMSTIRVGKSLDIGKPVQGPLSPPSSPLSQDALTLEHSTVSGVNFLEVTANEHSCSSVRNTDRGVRNPKKKTKDFPSYQSGSSVRRTLSCEMTCVNIHESGPSLDDTLSYIKRINYERSHHADMSTEGNDHEIKHKKIKLRPRKLFPSPDVQVPADHLSSVSGNNVSTTVSDTWDGSSSEVGVMCQQISKEFARKIQNRSRKMDYFTKQSLKSAQKHWTSIDVQVQECRMTHLEKFHHTMLEEIESFENDSQALKQMEKEFANFWSQQTQVLNLYHKNEQRRINCLKASFEMNVSHNTDYEEKIFNSEMHSMKENMKAVQERLLKEMQEEELLSVRRGLQSLFMSGSGPF
ncbi:synaptonemal complex protein 2 isoform X2 [Engystomops pustulosus]|uniref:synaptonemal complex protein 2 isoform X2 n=1 Tax=Engystomops pustulosus TaxID=76066 RepID=UPI003AFA6078